MTLNWRMVKENVVHLHNGVLLSIKKNDNLKYLCKWIELEKNIFNEVTQTQKDEHGMYPHIGEEC